MSALFIILVSLMMTLFSEKVLISNRYISGLMSNLIKKSWTDSIHQLQIAISSWEMLRFLQPIQSFIVLMGFVSLLAIPGHKSCKKVALVNSYLAPRQKKDKLEKSRKHFRTKQSSNWNYNCTKKTVSPF